MNPKLIISNYFDSLINRIDIHTEEQLGKSNENDFIVNEKPFDEERIHFQFNNYPYLLQYDLSNQPSREIAPGSVKVCDFLNETRVKLIGEINTAQIEAFRRYDEIRDQLKVINKDGSTKSQEQRGEEIKRKVFANEFLGLVQIEEVAMSNYDKWKNESPFKLYLVKLDFFMSQDETFLFSQMNNYLVGYMFFGEMISLNSKPELTDNRKHRLDKVGLRAYLLGNYLLGIIKHLFLNELTIREVDLFGIDKINIKNIPCFNHVDFGNDENSFFKIKSFVLKNDISDINGSLIAIKDMSSMVNLEHFKLYRASLIDTSFQGLTRLDKLKLIDCDFENFKSESLRYVPNLEGLSIIRPIKLNEINLKELSKLNSIRLVESSGIFQLLKNDNLEILHIKFEDDINFFDAISISGLPNLKILKLATASSDPCFFKCINLNYDYLSFLEKLFISFFHFPSLDSIILPEFRNLKLLSFSFCTTSCKINHANLFKKLIQVEMLGIHFSNFLKDTPSNIFDHLENLTDLNMSFNELIDIDLQWFSNKPKLMRINLESNNINRLSEEMFTHLTNLTSLNLSRNELNQLDNCVFSHLKNLEHLNISHNIYLVELKPEVFDGLDKLEFLGMMRLNANFELDVNLFKSLPSLKNVILDKRFEKLQPELSQKYGSKIKFDF